MKRPHSSNYSWNVDGDVLEQHINDYLNKRQIIVTGQTFGARHYAAISEWLVAPLMDGERVSTDSPIAEAMQAIAHGIAYAVLDRLKDEFKWTEEQDDRAFEVLCDKPQKRPKS